MTNLISTYRIQFHREFTLPQLEAILDYLQRIQPGCLYASPLFEAVPGSTHGYDGVNPHRINPEIGTIDELTNISKKLQAAGISWLQDIVPNHMAYDHRNKWLMDVLEKGPQSEFIRFFDTAWTSPLYQGRLMVPFLGSTLEEVIEKGELKIAYLDQRLVLSYYESYYPLQPLSYVDVLNASGKKIPQAIEQMLQTLPKIEEEHTYARQWDETRMQLSGLEKNEKINQFLKECIEAANKKKDLVKKIAGMQSYRLCHWQETDHQINYRRFFTVNGLICLNIQDDVVFKLYHQVIFQLLNQGVFQGLRIDHIDGLYDPSKYLDNLRNAAGEETPILVEKILEPGESLPAQWPIQGNTGYDFLSLVNNLLTNARAEKKFTRFYRELTADYRTFEEQVRDKKAYILFRHMAGELDNLYNFFRSLNLVNKKLFSSIRPDDLKEAIGELLIQCPVYRFYGNQFPLNDLESEAVRNVLDKIRRFNSELKSAVGLLEQVFLQLPHDANEETRQRIAQFYKRCMQFTGPLMAKGVEDTLMYTNYRFIGHNEVGDSPGSFGMHPDDFHKAMVARQQQWPYSLNATSTHDTKRGEDVRARLNVLTDLSEEWLTTVKEWQEQNKALKKENAPTVNDEYFIYQTLVGAYPMDAEDRKDFPNRIQEYIQKALREGKTNSNWSEPNESYEAASKEFAVALLNEGQPFFKSFQSLLNQVADHGIINSLVQLVLKFTCPGIPDVYQGCELWDLSLVDPDNRRAVDYKKRMGLLDSLTEKTNMKELWSERYAGGIKLWLTQQLFKLRKQQPDLFTSGEYIPLEIEGALKEHVFAFARKHRNQCLVVVLPMHTALLSKDQNTDVLDIDWKDTKIHLPQGSELSWQSLLAEEKQSSKTSLSIAELFRSFPMAVLKGQAVSNERGAGILLHISSLPSPYGIGDLGQESRAFADFLAQSRQKYWQLLPINPTEEGQGHSPYSSISSRAGNPLLISPEYLSREGLIEPSKLESYKLPQQGSVDHREAERVRAELFEEAWKTFKDSGSEKMRTAFEAFKEKENEWLDDFALYSLLKKEQGGKPWYEWPSPLKFREEASLNKLNQDHSDAIEGIKWTQFIFYGQWHAFRSHCNGLGIQLIGDLPFYVSYDSSDVWAHRHLFALDKEGNRLGLAGVPPDAFSSDGQLWGMPVFNWDILKEEKYEWWINRLKKNIELFDLVRLDHFRAFSAYWEVPAGEPTAKNGSWKQGPGADFFQAIETSLGQLPFIAEDLGEIDDAVYELRDQFGLKGMKVLQFAFGADQARSTHIPHNYKENFIVYTGTHDNNTTRGWFTKEADEKTRRGIETYVGRPVSAAEISTILSRMAYGSVAAIAILPLQDVLNLDEKARMNTPSSGSNNWGWRLVPGQVNTIAMENLKKWAGIYNRE